MMIINPFQVFLWTFRRKENDVVNLYNSLSPLMNLVTGGKMLNFGLWKEDTQNPFDAQIQLCDKVGDIAELASAKTLLDVGSGFSEPAKIWKLKNQSLNITCLNINFKQLKETKNSNGIAKLNSTSTCLPLAKNSFERIIALESAQHFKPLEDFVQESKRVLKKDGILVLALPVVSENSISNFMKLGILSFTWTSEHYSIGKLESILQKYGFTVGEIIRIGQWVYKPIIDFYLKNRNHLRDKILQKYPAYLESILFMSLSKMAEASKQKAIDYILIKSKF